MSEIINPLLDPETCPNCDTFKRRAEALKAQVEYWKGPHDQMIRDATMALRQRVTELETELSNSIHEHGQSSGFWGRAAAREVDLRKQAEAALHTTQAAHVRLRESHGSLEAENATLRERVRRLVQAARAWCDDADSGFDTAIAFIAGIVDENDAPASAPPETPDTQQEGRQ